MHRRRAYVATIVAFFVLVTAVPALGSTQADVEARRQKAERARDLAAAAEAKAKSLAKQADALDGTIDDLQAAVDALDPQIAEARARVDRLRTEVTELRGSIQRKQAQIEKTEAELTEQKTLLATRITSSYKAGEWYYLSLLFGSEDLGDFISRTELVSRVLEANRKLAVALDDTRAGLERDKSALDSDLRAVSEKRAEAEAVARKLNELQEAREARVAAQQAVYNEKSSMMAESKANAKRYRELAAQEEAEANRIASELASRPHGSGSYDGSMHWPTAAGSVTSGFGYRIHPIFGDRRLHTGIDIGAPMGTTVYAAGDGTVIKAEAGWGGGFGNRVWIDHGNGVVTTYNHLSGFSVSSGEKVNAGDSIARVGSSGYSTGPHLHFEVRVNGEPRDPMNYL